MTVYHGLNNECKLIISYAYPSLIVIIFIYLVTSLHKWHKLLQKGKTMEGVLMQARVVPKHSAAGSTKLHNIKIFIVLLTTKLVHSYKYTWSLQKLLKGVK